MAPGVVVNGVIRFALGLANCPDDLVADIDKELPQLAALITAAKEMAPTLRQLEPLLEQMGPHVAALLPIVQQALPLLNVVAPQLKAAYPEVVELLPVAERFVAFVQGSKTS